MMKTHHLTLCAFKRFVILKIRSTLYKTGLTYHRGGPDSQRLPNRKSRLVFKMAAALRIIKETLWEKNEHSFPAPITESSGFYILNKSTKSLEGRDRREGPGCPRCEVVVASSLDFPLLHIPREMAALE